MLTDRPQWRSIALRPLVLGLLLLCEIILLAVIIDLTVLSALHAGFIKISIDDTTSGTITLQSTLERVRRLLWTTVPTLILTLYRIFRESVVSALLVETPYIELRKSSANKPTKARKSVYLDYRTSFGIVAWYKALKNGHITLGLCMLFSFVVSLALVPLAGGLFAEGLEVLEKDSEIRILSAFDSRNIENNASTLDFGGLLDTVSGSWIDEAPYPAGTDGQVPLPQIEPIQKLENYTVSGSVATSQVSLDCVVVENANLDQGGSLIQQAAVTNFTAIDRDCEISGDILTLNDSAAGSLTYLKAYAQTDCASWAGQTRAVFLFVNTSDTGQWEDHILISCVPNYWSINGTISVTGSQSAGGKIAQTPSFHEKTRNIEDWDFLDRQTFENGVMNVVSVNAGGSANTGSRFAELMARYIVSRGSKTDKNSLIESSSVVFAATYTMFCIKYLYAALDPSIEEDGTLSMTQNRLHVIIPVSIAMSIILALLIVETIYLMVYLHKHPSILAEEPVGLVGAANLLHDSNIACLVATCHEKPTFDGRLRRPVILRSRAGKTPRTPQTDDEIMDQDCWVEREPGSTENLKIVLRLRTSEQQCSEILHGHKCDSAAAPASPHNNSLEKANATVQRSESFLSSLESLNFRREDRLGDAQAKAKATQRTALYRGPVSTSNESQSRYPHIDESDVYHERFNEAYQNDEDRRGSISSDEDSLAANSQHMTRYPSLAPRPQNWLLQS